MAFEGAKAPPKTDNNPHAIKAKAELRQRVLDAVRDQASSRSGPAYTGVFDAFAGSGQMFSAVWHRADHYVGCDLRWIRDGRRCSIVKRWQADAGKGGTSMRYIALVLRGNGA